MSNDIVAVTDEFQAQQVIEKMFQGQTKKAACAEVGISTKTFDRFVAASPQFVREVQATIRSQFAEYIDQISETRRKNLRAILNFSEDLRNEMLLAETIGGKVDAFSALLKLEKQLAASMEHILPAIKETGPSGPPKIDDDAAAAILAKLSGADLVTVTKTTTVELAHPEVIQAQEIPDPEQEPPQPTQET